MDRINFDFPGNRAELERLFCSGSFVDREVYIGFRAVMVDDKNGYSGRIITTAYDMRIDEIRSRIESAIGRSIVL